MKKNILFMVPFVFLVVWYSLKAIWGVEPTHAGEISLAVLCLVMGILFMSQQRILKRTLAREKRGLDRELRMYDQVEAYLNSMKERS